MSEEAVKLGRPFGNRVLVKQIEHEKKGNLILSGNVSTDSRFVKGVIVAVGEKIPNIVGVERDPGLSVGDVILYNPFNGVKITFPGDRNPYFSLPYSEILHIFAEKIEDLQVVENDELIPREATKNGNFF